MKKELSIILILLCSISCISAKLPVKVMPLKEITPVKTFYTGEVKAIEKGMLSFDMDGKIKTVKNAGEYVFAEIYNMETKKIIRPGTLIASFEKSRQEFALREAVMTKKIAEASYAKAKKNFERYKRLAKTNAVSAQDFLEIKTRYMNAELELSKAKNNVAIAKYDLEACDIKAPYSGIVTKILTTKGDFVEKGEDIVELTKMTPLLVEIPFPEEIVNNFREGTQVDIYPICGEKPVRAWCRTGLSENMLFAYIENFVVAQELDDGSGEPNNIKGSSLKKIYEIFPVKRISLSSLILNKLGDINIDLKEDKYPFAVPIKSIKKDGSQYYVLKIENTGKSGKLLRYKLKRVDIVPGGIERDFNLGSNRDVKIRSLKDPGTLKENDTIMLLGEDHLKDGDTVVFQNLRWKFVPEQLVKVSIPSLSGRGFYVPANTIIHQADNDNYVYIVEDGKARIVEVDITGRCSRFNRIDGDKINSEVKVIVFDDLAQSDRFYDGIEVEIVATLPPPVRLQYKRADRLTIGLNKLEKDYY